jgi:hypothetical protein
MQCDVERHRQFEGVDIATGLRAGVTEFDFRQEQWILLHSLHTGFGCTQPPFKAYRGSFIGGKVAVAWRKVKIKSKWSYPSIYVETSVRNKCRCSFYCALLTLHVSAPIGGHLQVVCNTKNSKAVTVYVNGSIASVCIKANAAVRWV